MAEAGVRALAAFPRPHNYVLRRESCGPILEAMVARRIPLILPVTSAVGWDAAYALLAEFPDLVCILGSVNTWGTVRFVFPLLEKYAHVYLDISEYILDGGIEAVAERCGARRMLFGTAFPSRPHGGMMLALKHAEISARDRQAVAAGNLERLLREEDLYGARSARSAGPYAVEHEDRHADQGRAPRSPPSSGARVGAGLPRLQARPPGDFPSMQRAPGRPGGAGAQHGCGRREDVMLCAPRRHHA